jgi:hypothetical protein
LVVAMASATSHAAPRAEFAVPARSWGRGDDRCRVRCADRGHQRIEAAQQDLVPADLGVAEPDTLFLLAVHPAQQPVHVDERDRRRAGQQRRRFSQADQERPRHGLQLAHVAVGERPQELTQRRRGVHPAEQLAHPAVADHVQIVDRVRPGEHARHNRGDLPRRVGSLVRRHMQPPADNAVQIARLRQPHHRLQTRGRHQIRIVERCADRANSVL